MSKSKTSFYISDDAHALLKKLAEKHDRSPSNMLEQLIKEAAKKEKIKLT